MWVVVCLGALVLSIVLVFLGAAALTFGAFGPLSPADARAAHDFWAQVGVSVVTVFVLRYGIYLLLRRLLPARAEFVP